MKKLFSLICIITLTAINIYISKKNEYNFEIYVGLQSVALADSEGEDNRACYTSFVYCYDAYFVKCNTPCCWSKNQSPTHEVAGFCSGSSFNYCSD